MKLLCLFFPCLWVRICNVSSASSVGGSVGLYQCRRCKTISVGAPR